MIFEENLNRMTINELENFSNSVISRFASFNEASWKFSPDIVRDGDLSADTADLFSINQNHPVIHISNNECTVKQSENIFDLLGVYKFVAPNSSGEIIMYSKCIAEYAESMFNNTTYLGIFTSVLECEKFVYKVVLFHELGHWISHWSLDSNNNFWSDDFWELRPNPNDLLEGLAQYICYYFILHDKDCNKLKFTFEHLLLNSSPPYHKHIEIIKHKKNSFINMLSAIEKIRLKAINDQTLEQFLNELDKIV